MISYDIALRDGAWLVKRGPGDIVPILHAGRPVELAAGWAIVRLLCNLGSTNALQLRHVSGEGSVWFLNSDYAVKCNTVEQLPEPERADFIRVAMRHISAAWEQLIVSGSPLLSEDTRCFLEFGGNTLNDVVRLAGQSPYPRMPSVRMDQEDEVASLASFSGLGLGGKFDVEIVRQIFSRDCLRDAVLAAAHGRLVLPSPFDGQEVGTDVGVCLTHSTFAYRFVDGQRNLTYYVVVSLWRAVVVALYFPALSLTIYADHYAAKETPGFLGTDIDAALFDHVLRFGIELEAYLQAPQRRVTFVYHQGHLGHHLWNELTGLQQITNRLPVASIPDIWLINAAESEMYGRIDEIFPTLTGKVDRTPSSRDSLIRRTYREARCLFYPTADYISAELAQRIVDHAEQDSTLEGARREAAQLAAEGFLIVLLGLRVENRTLADPTGFYVEVISILRDRGHRVAAVIDGHNGAGYAGSGHVYRSHAENLTARPPADVEHDIVAQLRARFAADDQVRIVSTVGEPVGASLLWCRRATFFVTPWGAGLAKYRWVCNQRGLVVAGQRFFRHAGQRTVHLYDSSDFMEAPTPLNFVAPDDVQDEPDAPLLIGLQDANRVNFSINPAALRARLIQLMLSLGIE